ncbi:MAG TPA: potassium channel family protein [Nocardioidaceae bacterium]
MRSDHGRRKWLGPMVSLLALLVAYFAWPVHQRGAGLVASILLTLVAVGILGWAIAVQVRRHLLDDEKAEFPTLVTLLGVVVVVFAFGYYRLEVIDPGQMSGLRTKTDSLYFTVQMLTTVGLGDVYAAGQLARQLVLVQMVFDIVFVAAAGSMVVGKVREHMRPGREAGGAPRDD